MTIVLCPKEGIEVRKMWAALLAVEILAGAPWALTQAIFTDARDLGANALSTGSVDIATGPTETPMTYSVMVPGDKVTAAVPVSNGGTLGLRYAMSTAISGSSALSDALTLVIRSGVTTCSNAGFAADGTPVYSGSLTGGAIGDATQGFQAGDRTLNASGSETLCFQVQLPTTAAGSLQRSSATATFTFIAEHSENENAV